MDYESDENIIEEIEKNKEVKEEPKESKYIHFFYLFLFRYIIFTQINISLECCEKFRDNLLKLN